MSTAVFMPAVGESDKPTTSRTSSSSSLSSSSLSSSSIGTSSIKVDKSSDEEENDKDESKRTQLPGDAWMVPINLAQDIGTIHFLAGFDKEGM